MKKDNNLNIPPQETGASTKAEHSVTLKTEKEALEIFERAKHNITDVNHWDKICGTGSAVFRLMDVNGQPVNRTVEVNDYFKIKYISVNKITKNVWFNNIFISKKQILQTILALNKLINPFCKRKCIFKST